MKIFGNKNINKKENSDDKTDIFITFTLQIVSQIVEVGISKILEINVKAEVNINISWIVKPKYL